MNEGSVTQWLQDLRTGDDEAASKLWSRYFHDMARAAERRLGNSVAAFDGEDIALSAFHAFCEAIQQGRYEGLSRRTGLWSLLAAVTLRKASDHLKVEGADRRGGGRSNDRALQGGVELDTLPGRFSDPQFLAMMSDQCRRLLDLLDDQELEKVALCRLDGYNDSEIAQRLGYSRRTIQRMLTVIRKHWKNEMEQRTSAP